MIAVKSLLLQVEVGFARQLAFCLFVVSPRDLVGFPACYGWQLATVD